MKSSLTLHERVFVEKYIELQNGTKAALVAYNIQGKDKNKIASTIASQVLQRPRVREYMAGVIPDEDLITLLRRALEATEMVKTSYSRKQQPLWSVRLRALELCCRLKGYLDTGNRTTNTQSAHGKVDVTFEYNKYASDKWVSGVPEPSTGLPSV